ncbi:hypothetical protein OF83DRAFT_481091 [Amylostereum chailletii]|nr:hypothetical protein OF83DRAFT_481091 [Amylostereum chailletii]
MGVACIRPSWTTSGDSASTWLCAIERRGLVWASRSSLGVVDRRVLGPGGAHLRKGAGVG